LERIENVALAPSQVQLEIPQQIANLYPTLSPEQMQEFVAELERDQTELEKQVQELHLDQYYDQIMSLVSGFEKDVEMTE
jgi:ABC-type multidrug transport system ATPase subunit